jgi:(p)ppGpp synthase/HD superfamily hydrolase
MPMSARPVHAQTNVQLYAQLLELRWPEADLLRIRAGHDLATQVHAARFRASGRPFLAHLAGTASLLAWLGAGPDVVLAGLLHAVYDQGDFGDGVRAVSPAKRAFVRSAVGEAVEALVAAYTELGWDLSVLARTEGRLEALAPLDRDVLRVRLANELDDHLDLDVLYDARRSERLAYLAEATPGLARLSRFLGHENLARAFEETAKACREARIPESLCSDQPYCFDVVPRSTLRRPRAAWNRGRPWRAWQLSRARRWLRRLAVRVGAAP